MVHKNLDAITGSFSPELQNIIFIGSRFIEGQVTLIQCQVRLIQFIGKTVDQLKWLIVIKDFSLDSNLWDKKGNI